MPKQEILDALLGQLQLDLESLVNSAFEAKEAATSEESKAENKYDTRGLEASYLAGAQAKRAEELKKAIYSLKEIKLRSFSEQAQIGLTALIQVSIDGEDQKLFFMLPSAGGTRLFVRDQEYFVITPESPVGGVLLGKKRKDIFEVKINKKTHEYEILEFE